MRILYSVCDIGSTRPLQKLCRLTGLSKQTVNSALRKSQVYATNVTEAPNYTPRLCDVFFSTALPHTLQESPHPCSFSSHIPFSSQKPASARCEAENFVTPAKDTHHISLTQFFPSRFLLTTDPVFRKGWPAYVSPDP